MLLALASVEALSLRLGITLAGTEVARAAAILDDDAEQLLDVPAVVESVTLAAAYRAFRNPDGVSQTSLGDASVSYDRGTAQAAVYLTRDERRAVRRAAGTTAVGVIELASPWAMPTSDYPVAVAGGGDPVPIGPFPWEAL